jgi:hypothetical protein
MVSNGISTKLLLWVKGLLENLDLAKMNCLEAIDIAHLGRTKPIEISTNGNVMSWTETAVKDYKEYVKAIEYLDDNHSLLSDFLRLIKYI